MSLEAGYYTGKIVAYGMKETQKGDVAPTVGFLVKTPDGKVQKLFWQGTLTSDKAADIALKALIVCGLQRYEDLDALADGPDSGVLDMEKDIDLTVELNVTDDGKSYPRVSWINEAGGKKGGDQKMITREAASTRLAMLNLGNKFGLLKQKADADLPLAPPPF